MTPPDTKEARNLTPEERLYAAMVRKTIEDFENGSLSAACWFVSRVGVRWLSIGGLDHMATLERIGWAKGARQIVAQAIEALADPEAKPPQKAVRARMEAEIEFLQAALSRMEAT